MADQINNNNTCNNHHHHHNNNQNHNQPPAIAANSSAKRAPPTNEAEERLAIERELAAKLKGTRDYLSTLSTEATPCSSEQQQDIRPTTLSHGHSETATGSGDASRSAAPLTEPIHPNRGDHGTPAGSVAAAPAAAPPPLPPPAAAPPSSSPSSSSMAAPDASSSLPPGDAAMLDGGQNAEEQRLEPDVRFLSHFPHHAAALHCAALLCEDV